MSTLYLFDLPSEIVDLIYEFAAPFNNIKKKVCKELLLNVTCKFIKKEVNLLEYYFMDNKPHRSYRLSRYIDSDGCVSRSLISAKFSNSFSKSELCVMFKNLTTCSCCQIHLSNNPKTITSTWDEQPICPLRYNLHEEQLCSCPCRHYRRILCRSHYLLCKS
jgi:hypothetical protein